MEIETLKISARSDCDGISIARRIDSLLDCRLVCRDMDDSRARGPDRSEC